MLKILLGLFLALSLFACGGGSQGYDIAVPTPATLRTDLKFGYYLTCPTCVEPTVGHINLLWVEGMWDAETAIANMQKAKISTVYDVSQYVFIGPSPAKLNPLRELTLRQHFQRLSDLGLLKYVVAISPIDESDINVADQADVIEANKTIRKVAAEFPEIASVPILMIFAGVTRLHNIGDFDIVGADAYDDKSSILLSGGQYDFMRSKMKPNARTMLIVGGSFGQDPAPFVNYAQAHKEVWAVVAFTYENVSGLTGIRNTPLRVAYCQAGKQITGKSGDCL